MIVDCAQYYLFYVKNTINNSIFKIICLEIQGLKLVFPVDNSLQGCYKDRASCVARDFQGEVSFLRFLTNREIYLPFFQLDHLLTSFSDLWDFGRKWFGLYDKVEEMAVEGQL